MACPGEGASKWRGARPIPAPRGATVEHLIGWLESVVQAATSAADRSERFGLFGTATGATWLTGELGDRVRFFVDEDPSRIGRTHLDRPIYAPAEVPPESVVYVALPPASAESVARAG